MKGDVILVEEHHRKAAEEIAEALTEKIKAAGRIFTLTVAGESGSGKSETAQALKESFEKRGMNTLILQQDDYFIRPPKTNDALRRRMIGTVGTEEVKLKLLNAHLIQAKKGDPVIIKPLILYAEDKQTNEDVSCEGLSVVIAEGTYTTLCDEADCHIFIARDYHETLPARKRRAREAFDPFIEQVLEIEHGIIAEHREKADIVITNDYNVVF
ncbi:MAG: hypothetical protein B0D92_06240 [Spirochaeta sp. LUC14_002_19_P3]|nr:MAG: hypothetical protein B0D92_06240 [Spirochaeta sp. LUC14_002_19_P3]